MKYIRLRIANYRGVKKEEIKFASNGITLIRGPNEAGKTSLGEAIRLLFEYPDNSKHREILAIKPVQRDEGPEIELEAESGRFHFIYFKRFIKKPETRLMITRPKAESITGRQAHERAESILKDTLDVSLWKALSIRQGSEIDQPVLEGQTWLSAALDRVAGGSSADARSENLFGEVHEEYLKYFTENGAERRELAQRRNAIAECRSTIQEIEHSIQDLEKDMDRAVRLKEESSQLKRSQHELTVELEKRSAKLKEIEILEHNFSEAKLKHEAALASEKAARGDKEKREKLIKEIGISVKTTTDLAASEAESLTSLDQAKNDRDKAHKLSSEAEKQRKEYIELLGLRQRDRDYLRDKLDLEMMQERIARIDKARENCAGSKIIMQKNKVDERALKSVEMAQNAVINAQAKLEAKAPSVSLHALGDCHIVKDGVNVKLASGEEHFYTISDKVTFTVPNKFEMEITAGSSVDTLMKKVEEAQDNLKEVCSAIGLADPSGAREAFEVRKAALKQIKDLEQIENDNLRDLSYEELAQRILELQGSVPTYLTIRTSAPPIIDTFDLAKTELEKLEKNRASIQDTWETSKSAYDQAKEVHENRKGKHIEAHARWNHSKENLDRLENMLKDERADVTDEELTKAWNNAKNAVSKAQTDINTCQESFKSLNPEQEKDLEQTARESLERIQLRMKEVDKELVEVETRLKIGGEDGLSGKLNDAKSALERSTYGYDSAAKRAAAARLLYEIMNQERDQARHAYVAPLRERIEALGRLVFDETLHVEISDDLKIVSRTLQDATVPFDSLSGGTKEQLSLIFRLACAMIVAEDGGAPLMLDDALGYTDPDRLHLMGAVLVKATRECQVVIFTCVPDRYSNIGAAKEIVISN
jgi:DNA repair exonuclease SbcCD ATPase subunit